MNSDDSDNVCHSVALTPHQGWRGWLVSYLEVFRAGILNLSPLTLNNTNNTRGWLP